MTRTQKIRLLAGLVLAIVAAWGVYWWHEASLDALAQEYRLYEGPALGEIARLLTAPIPDKAAADKRLKALDPDEQLLLLQALAADTRVPARLFAASALGPFKDRPVGRAVLARLATADPEARVKEAAKKTLAE